MKDLQNENYKTLMNETKEAEINGKISCVCGFNDLILLNCLYYKKYTDLT